MKTNNGENIKKKDILKNIEQELNKSGINGVQNITSNEIFNAFKVQDLTSIILDLRDKHSKLVMAGNIERAKQYSEIIQSLTTKSTEKKSKTMVDKETMFSQSHKPNTTIEPEQPIAPNTSNTNTTPTTSENEPTVQATKQHSNTQPGTYTNGRYSTNTGGYSTINYQYTSPTGTISQERIPSNPVSIDRNEVASSNVSAASTVSDGETTTTIQQPSITPTTPIAQINTPATAQTESVQDEENDPEYIKFKERLQQGVRYKFTRADGRIYINIINKIEDGKVYVKDKELRLTTLSQMREQYNRGSIEFIESGEKTANQARSTRQIPNQTTPTTNQPEDESSEGDVTLTQEYLEFKRKLKVGAKISIGVHEVEIKTIFEKFIFFKDINNLIKILSLIEVFEMYKKGEINFIESTTKTIQVEETPNLTKESLTFEIGNTILQKGTIFQENYTNGIIKHYIITKIDTDYISYEEQNNNKNKGKISKDDFLTKFNKGRFSLSNSEIGSTTSENTIELLNSEKKVEAIVEQPIKTKLFLSTQDKFTIIKESLIHDFDTIYNEQDNKTTTITLSLLNKINHIGKKKINPIEFIYMFHDNLGNNEKSIKNELQEKFKILFIKYILNGINENNKIGKIKTLIMALGLKVGKKSYKQQVLHILNSIHKNFQSKSVLPYVEQLLPTILDIIKEDIFYNNKDKITLSDLASSKNPNKELEFLLTTYMNYQESGNHNLFKTLLSHTIIQGADNQDEGQALKDINTIIENLERLYSTNIRHPSYSKRLHEELANKPLKNASPKPTEAPKNITKTPKKGKKKVEKRERTVSIGDLSDNETLLSKLKIAQEEKEILEISEKFQNDFNTLYDPSTQSIQKEKIMNLYGWIGNNLQELNIIKDVTINHNIIVVFLYGELVSFFENDDFDGEEIKKTFSIDENDGELNQVIKIFTTLGFLINQKNKTLIVDISYNFIEKYIHKLGIKNITKLIMDHPLEIEKLENQYKEKGFLNEFNTIIEYMGLDNNIINDIRKSDSSKKTNMHQIEIQNELFNFYRQINNYNDINNNDVEKILNLIKEKKEYIIPSTEINKDFGGLILYITIVSYFQGIKKAKEKLLTICGIDTSKDSESDIIIKVMKSFLDTTQSSNKNFIMLISQKYIGGIVADIIKDQYEIINNNTEKFHTMFQEYKNKNLEKEFRLILTHIGLQKDEIDNIIKYEQTEHKLKLAQGEIEEFESNKKINRGEYPKNDKIEEMIKSFYNKLREETKTYSTLDKIKLLIKECFQEFNNKNQENKIKTLQKLCDINVHGEYGIITLLKNLKIFHESQQGEHRISGDEITEIEKSITRLDYKNKDYQEITSIRNKIIEVIKPSTIKFYKEFIENYNNQQSKNQHKYTLHNFLDDIIYNKDPSIFMSIFGDNSKEFMREIQLSLPETLNTPDDKKAKEHITERINNTIKTIG